MTAETLAAPVRLDLWADIACPWCFVGSARLDAVLAEAETRGEVVELRHRAFELNPGMPSEGVPMAGFLEAKFGGTAALDEAKERLRALGAEVGIDFDFEAVGKAPSTRLAHHLLSTYDGDLRQRTALRSLYSAYFERGLDVTDGDVVVGVVSEATGESRDDVRVRLTASLDGVDAEIELGRSLGISSVPTFIADAGAEIDPAVGLSAAAVAMQGAQPTEALEQLLSEARRRAAV